MKFRFITADVFTNQIFGGNPLAVIPEAFGLKTDQMQKVAREFNLSETVFVFPPDHAENTRKLQIFTPGAELPFAGHPTLGTAYVLSAIGLVPLQEPNITIRFEEGIGLVPVHITVTQGRPTFAKLSVAKMPEFQKAVPDVSVLASVLGIGPEEILTGIESPEVGSCGVPFLMIPVRDRETLARIRVREELWAREIANTDAPHLYVFTRNPQGEEAEFRVRMFAPGLGISEDPATGGAAAPFGAYLAARSNIKSGILRWNIEQGVEMGRPSLLKVEVELGEGKILAVHVGGSAVLVSEGWIEIP